MDVGGVLRMMTTWVTLREPKWLKIGCNQLALENTSRNNVEKMTLGTNKAEARARPVDSGEHLKKSLREVTSTAYSRQLGHNEGGPDPLSQH